MLIKIIVTAIDFLLVSISCELSAGTKVVPALVITGIRTVIRTVESVGRRIIIFICIARTLKPQPLVILAGSVVLVSKIVDIAVLEEMFAEKIVDQEVKLDHKEEITIDDFSKVEMRVGKVVKCEKHPKADKLLVSQIKIGSEVRQIVSGIANYYKPEDMVGKSVVVVCNLKPVKLRGVESQGMILAAGNDGDALVLPEAIGANDGAEVR